MTKSRLKTILKKAIIQFALFTFLFLSASVTLISFGNTSYSSFSSFLVHQRENNKLKFNYGEVKSNNLEGYTNFYWHADDKPGSNLRENMFTFFKTLTDDEKSYVFSSEEQSTSADLLLYTTWDFENYHYNFDIVKNKNDYKLNVGEIYLTESLANILFPNLDRKFESILDQNISSGSNKLTIKGVILDESLGFFKSTIGNTFVMGNYNYKPFITRKMIYEFMMFGGDVDTFADVACIEGAIQALNRKDKIFESFYYDYEKSFVLGKSQNIKQSTIIDYRYNVFLIIIGMILLASAMCLNLYYFIGNNNKFTILKNAIKNKQINNCFDFFVSFASFSLILLLLRIIGLVKINNVVINLFDFNIVTLLFIIWIGLSIALSIFNIVIRKDNPGSPVEAAFYNLKI